MIQRSGTCFNISWRRWTRSWREVRDGLNRVAFFRSPLTETTRQYKARIGDRYDAEIKPLDPESKKAKKRELLAWRRKNAKAVVDAAVANKKLERLGKNVLTKVQENVSIGFSGV